MSLPIVTLPSQEQWSCHNCGICCKGSIVPLTVDDRRKLAEQRWEATPEFRGVKTVVAHGLLSRTYELAKRPDGSCVFLTPEGLCEIHRRFGFEAKPLICQSFPLQLVPRDRRAVLTLRRCCPSAALDRGQPLAEQRREAQRIADQYGTLDESGLAPFLVGQHRRTWREAFRVLEALERLMLDARYPIVRRLLHGCAFCDALDNCRLDRVADTEFSELIRLLEEAARQDESVSAAFRDRKPPGKGTAVMFRQAAAEHVRLLPRFRPEGSWRERWRLIWGAIQLVRGRGTLPLLHPELPTGTFDDLERPLAALDPALYQPLARFYETSAASYQYALVQRLSWSVVDNFRALALTYPIALWLLRWKCIGRSPTQDDMVSVIAAIDRGQGYEQLTGVKHFSRVRTLAGLGEWPELLAWYGR